PVEQRARREPDLAARARERVLVSEQRVPGEGAPADLELVLALRHDAPAELADLAVSHHHERESVSLVAAKLSAATADETAVTQDGPLRQILAAGLVRDVDPKGQGGTVREIPATAEDGIDLVLQGAGHHRKL